jgi:CheY-like chemotaxis protein
LRGDRYRGVVFLVEDEDAPRAKTEAVLENCGYLVLTARNGAEALARMRGLSVPAVAVVDLIRARDDGAGLIAAMKADAELGRIPVIAVAAPSDSAQSVEARLEVERLMRKPFALTELVAEVGALFTAPQAAPRTSV